MRGLTRAGWQDKVCEYFSANPGNTFLREKFAVAGWRGSTALCVSMTDNQGLSSFSA
jgi:hypothetical protein